MPLIDSEDRDFVGYGSTPPEVEWPGGARLAVSICVNYEEGSEKSLYFGDAYDEPLSEWGGYGFPIPGGERNRTNESFTEYGSRVAFWRLIDLFGSHEVPVTFLACGVALERNPEAARAIPERGHEVCCHGYRWENHYGMTRGEEKKRIAAAIESLKRTTGVRPIGWYAREGLTANTRELLVDAGFVYDSNSYADDIPYYVGVRGKPHLIVPYSGDLNDVRYWISPGYAHADDYQAVLRDTFDWLSEESKRVPRMMSIGLHMRISGRPSRIVALQRFLDYIKEKQGVWVARRDEIARWWLQQAPPERAASATADVVENTAE
jgi:peptidoglycan/xylan/chitin deacetylase (PgdA/CDA1 family)